MENEIPCEICGIFIKARRDFLLHSQKNRGEFVSEEGIGEGKEKSFPDPIFPGFGKFWGSSEEFSTSLKDVE